MDRFSETILTDGEIQCEIGLKSTAHQYCQGSEI
jgi:hypothetical protein